MIAYNHESHEECRNVCVPRWAFRIMVGFVYLSVLCASLTVILVVIGMFYLTAKTDQIRKAQVRDATRFEKVIEEERAAASPSP